MAFINLKMSTRSLFVGIPAAMLTLVLAVVMSRSHTALSPVVDIGHTSVSDVVQSASGVAPAVQEGTDAAIDRAVTDLVADAQSEIATIDDEVALNYELDTYSSLKTTSYETQF